MTNYRSGYLQRGGPVGQKTMTAALQDTSTEIDPKGYTALKLLGEDANINQIASATGGNPYVITVTTVDHGLATNDVVVVYDAAGWTNSSLINQFEATITVVDADNFTYQIVTDGTDPGASGTVSWKLPSSDRPFTLKPSTIVGHQLLIYLGNDAQAQMETSLGVHLNSTWSAIDQYDSLTLVFQDDKWVEVSRGLLGSDFDERIFHPESGQLVIYSENSGYFENQTMTDDATISSTGRFALSQNIRRRTIVQFSAAQLNDLHNTPRQALAPQGEGQRVIVDELQFYYFYDGALFAGDDTSTLSMQYTNTPTPNTIANVAAEWMWSVPQNNVAIAKPSLYDVGTNTVDAPEVMFFANNMGLQFSNIGTAITGGSGALALEVHVIYHTMHI